MIPRILLFGVLPLVTAPILPAPPASTLSAPIPSAGSEPILDFEGPGMEMDVSQARLMLDFLDAVSSGDSPGRFLDSLMQAEGTGLIIAQMNLARRVSPDQYRQLLQGFMEGTRPRIEPVDSTRRAARGVEGLLKDVWPALTWGLTHTSELRARVNHLEELDLYALARKLANRFLPDSLEGSPGLFAVMGGRAGGAKLDGDRIYLDVLVYSYHGRRTGEFPTDQELTRTIAHELHHMGYGPYLTKWANGLNPTARESLQARFLSGLLTEGSATYLISAGRSLAEMREDRAYAGLLDNPGALIDQVEAILLDIQEGRIRSEAEFEEATADLVGSWYHSAGSLLLGVIDEAGGLTEVEEVIRDPRRLLSAYNRAVAALGANAPARPFGESLAEDVATMGRGPLSGSR